MNWQNRPIGMTRHDELLNALVALWKTRCSISLQTSDAAALLFEQGFEEGLNAVAQIVGLSSDFEAVKAEHYAQRRTHSVMTVIQELPQLLDNE